VTQAKAREARVINGLKALAEKTGNAASSKD
jgi:hypothetical protein